MMLHLINDIPCKTKKTQRAKDCWELRKRCTSEVLHSHDMDVTCLMLALSNEPRHELYICHVLNTLIISDAFLFCPATVQQKCNHSYTMRYHDAAANKWDSMQKKETAVCKRLLRIAEKYAQAKYCLFTILGFTCFGGAQFNGYIQRVPYDAICYILHAIFYMLCNICLFP